MTTVTVGTSRPMPGAPSEPQIQITTTPDDDGGPHDHDDAGSETKDDVTITIKETGGPAPHSDRPLPLSKGNATAKSGTKSAKSSKKSSAQAAPSPVVKTAAEPEAAPAEAMPENMPFAIPRLAPRPDAVGGHGGGHHHRTLHAKIRIPQPRPQPQSARAAADEPSPPPAPASVAPPASTYAPLPSATIAGTQAPAPVTITYQLAPQTHAPATLVAPQPTHVPHHTHRFPHTAETTSETMLVGTQPDQAGQPSAFATVPAEAQQTTYVTQAPGQTIYGRQAIIPTGRSSTPGGLATQAPAPPIAPIHYVQAQTSSDPQDARYTQQNVGPGDTSMLGNKGWAETQMPNQSMPKQSVTPAPSRFSQIKPIPIIDYHALALRSSPALRSSMPIPEIPNPASGPAPVFQTTRGLSAETNFPASTRNGGARHGQDHYARHDSGDKHHHRHHHGHHRSGPEIFSDSSDEYVEPESEHHHRHHRRHHHRDRPYRKVEDDEPPADRNGRYAYPPDYDERLARERVAKETDWERQKKRIEGGQWPGLPGSGGYLGMGPAMYGRPLMPPFIGGNPPFRPVQFPMMDMGMGMPGMIPGMGIPGPIIPAMVPPMMGAAMGGFNPNAIPGRFGRDVLGRDFAGPGGIGRSRPYRPPDPTVLHPMPQGLPVQARPPVEGLDAFGRAIPPKPPEGFDGWGNWTDHTKPDPRVLGTMPGFTGAPPGRPPYPGGPGSFGWTGVPPREPPPPSSSKSKKGSKTGRGSPSADDSARPAEPPMFSRAPSTDPQFSYNDFKPFSFEARQLAHLSDLTLPREFRRRDIFESDWQFFLQSLATEAFRYASSSADSNLQSYDQEQPRLTSDVHALISGWNVGFFGPRSVRCFPAKNGKRIYPGLANGRDRAAMTLDKSSSISSYSSDDEDDELPRVHQSARERRHLREQRRRRRRERKEAAEFEREATEVGDWQIRFTWCEPLRWTPGTKPRQYGDKNNWERPKMTPGMMGMGGIGGVGGMGLPGVVL